MTILIVKTGVEKYANRIFTSDFFLAPQERGDATLPIAECPTYMAHERIICGFNGCFGEWQIGHISLPEGANLFGVFTRKILMYDPHREERLTHKMLHCAFSVGHIKNCRYTLNYWGDNDGNEISVMLSGKFRLTDEKKEVYKISTPLGKLPF